MTEKTKGIAIFNEDGTIKDKKEFLKTVEELYDSVSEEINETEEDNEIYDSYFNLITDPEAVIDVESTLETFDFTERTIYITDEIKPALANSIFEIIRFWNKVDNEDEIPIEERNPINIYINTPGGDIDAVFSIISSIKASKTPVHTITIGTGYSGGFFIGICGHKRFGLAHTSYLFHEGAAMDGGDAHKFLQRMEFYKLQLARLKQITLDNTHITNDEYEAHRKDDWFMDPHDAIKYGVIDEIIETL
jgi:ATP-dependent Clp protease protease subunit